MAAPSLAQNLFIRRALRWGMRRSPIPFLDEDQARDLLADGDLQAALRSGRILTPEDILRATDPRPPVIPEAPAPRRITTGHTQVLTARGSVAGSASTGFTTPQIGYPCLLRRVHLISSVGSVSTDRKVDVRIVYAPRDDSPSAALGTNFGGQSIFTGLDWSGATLETVEGINLPASVLAWEITPNLPILTIPCYLMCVLHLDAALTQVVSFIAEIEELQIGTLRFFQPTMPLAAPLPRLSQPRAPNPPAVRAAPRAETTPFQDPRAFVLHRA